MTARASSLATGDVVTLKGQSSPLTVIPEPHGAISKEGWVWLAHVGSAVSITLLPIEALATVAKRSNAGRVKAR